MPKGFLPLIFVCLFSCPAWTYDLQHGPLSLMIPKGWEIQEGADVVLLMAKNRVIPQALSNSVAAPFRNTIVVTREALDETSARLFRKDGVAYLQNAQHQIAQNITEIEKGIRTFGHIKGAFLKVIAVGGDIKICSSQFSFLDGQYLYSVAFSVLAEDREATKDLARSIFNSIKKR